MNYLKLWTLLLTVAITPFALGAEAHKIRGFDNVSGEGLHLLRALAEHPRFVGRLLNGRNIITGATVEDIGNRQITYVISAALRPAGAGDEADTNKAQLRITQSTRPADGAITDSKASLSDMIK